MENHSDEASSRSMVSFCKHFIDINLHRVEVIVEFHGLLELSFCSLQIKSTFYILLLENYHIIKPRKKNGKCF